jgi:hypothetical protein
MRGYVPPDPETRVSQECIAVVQTGRQPRRRFPAGFLEVVDSIETAIEKASTANNLYAARVLGPSKSSEGQYIYYLVEWLEQ